MFVNSQPEVFSIGPNRLHKLLAAINECTEWGQVAILSALGEYTPAGGSEAKEIGDRIVPRLQHANAAVVLGAVKVLLGLLPRVGDEEWTRNVIKKMSPPLGIFDSM